MYLPRFDRICWVLDGLIQDLCRVDNFTEGFKAVFRQRPGRNRKKLLLLMASMWFVLFNSESKSYVERNIWSNSNLCPLLIMC